MYTTKGTTCWQGKGIRIMTFKTNSSLTTKSMTEWYFGKKFVAEKTAEAKRMNKKTGKTEFRFWQDGTGYLTIKLA